MFPLGIEILTLLKITNNKLALFDKTKLTRKIEWSVHSATDQPFVEDLVSSFQLGEMVSI